MLGRLRMTVEECLNAYTSVVNQVFVKKSHRISLTGKIQARYDSAALLSVIKSIVIAAGFDEKTLLWDPDPHSCRV